MMRNLVQREISIVPFYKTTEELLWLKELDTQFKYIYENHILASRYFNPPPPSKKNGKTYHKNFTVV
jgi:hypothetical protein